VITRWIVRNLIGYPIFYTIVSWRKLVRFFKDWGYKYRSVVDIVAGREKAKKDTTVTDSVANSNFKSIGEMMSSSCESRVMVRDLQLLTEITSQLMKNSAEHQRRKD